LLRDEAVLRLTLWAASRVNAPAASISIHRALSRAATREAFAFLLRRLFDFRDIGEGAAMPTARLLPQLNDRHRL
jgi:hypothetical protein